ncbi:ATP-binding cassette domain-containing protein [Methylacidiphilum caldifontis]|uniref:ABC transporter ATP-binding protein n=1 Tax=Methylacidiphilum caldifontis TaxID=2795386 RepID=UPI001A9057F8|nr:ATP-binding cassette domain-containing protein [Methylacidiphilum caldifontis]QSR89550.1 ATP-binding cassette domain-containing protein [Methylacidiphilum caldifontis]
MIRFERIYKSFGRRKLFEDLNFELKEKKTIAILGPNGSGKTTLIKILLGLVIPDKGKVVINNRDIYRDARYKKIIGYMPQIPEFPENLKVREIISMIEDIRDQKAIRLKELLDLLNLGKELEKKFSSLSGGTRQKVGALVALAFDTPLLILDEPLVGIDPISAYRLKGFILEEKKRDKTVIYISHIMNEVEEIADEVVFLTDGKVIFEGSLVDLKKKTGKVRLEEAVICLLSS